MRIAHVITRLIVGGAQENTLLSCQELIQAHGDEVLLITGPAIGPEGSLLPEATARKIPVKIIPSLRRPVHAWHDVLGYQRLKSVLREFQPQVVHTHSAKGGILGRMAASSLRVPVVVHTVHGAPFHDYQNAVARNLIRLCEQFAATRCHALVSVADAMTDQLVQARVAPREKFTTIYSGLQVEPFLDAETHREATRLQWGYAPQHTVVGKVARLFELKGHQYLIDAAPSIVKNFPDIRFLLVGDGILRKQLQQRIDRLGLREYFQFTGLVDPAAVPSLLSAMDMLVHTSLREGLARALPQALLAGRPVISYDIDGAREVVIPGKTGILLPPQSVKELSASVIQLAQDASLRTKLARAGQRLCEQRFHYQSMAQQLRQLYLDLLPARGS